MGTQRPPRTQTHTGAHTQSLSINALCVPSPPQLNQKSSSPWASALEVRCVSAEWGWGDGLGHCTATSPRCPGPTAAGAAIGEQTVLGVRDSQEPKVRSMPPLGPPPEAASSWGQEGAMQVFKFHGAHPPRKRRSGRGRNGAFNVQTQPVSHVPGKNQISVEIPHTLASSLLPPGPEGQRGPEHTEACSYLHPSLHSHPEETVTRPTRGLWRPSWCTLVHRCVGQPMWWPSEHPTDPDRCSMGWWPTWLLLCQEAHQKVVTPAPNGPKKMQLKRHHRHHPRVSHGDGHPCPKGQPRGHPQCGRQGTQWVNQQGQSRGGLHGTPRPTEMSKAVITVPDGWT